MRAILLIYLGDNAMRIYLTFLCIVSALVLVSTEALCASYNFIQQQCRELAQKNPPEIEIIYNYGELKYNTDLYQVDLAQIDAVLNHKNRRDLTGLTDLDPVIEMDGAVLKYKVMDGDRICVYPQKLTVKVKYSPTVYILTTLPKDSCKYKMAVRHGQAHAELGYMMLNLLVKALRNKLPEIAKYTTVNVINSTDGEQTLFLMNETYQRQIYQLWEVFNNALKERQLILDSDEVFAREAGMCL